LADWRRIIRPSPLDSSAPGMIAHLGRTNCP